MDKGQKQPSDTSALEQVKLMIEALQARLQQGRGLPDGADELLRKLLEPAPLVSEEDEEMLPLIVSDALEGVDIRIRYPTFFNKLLENAALREAFLEVMDLLEEAIEGEDFSVIVGHDPMPLDFLSSSVASSPKIERFADSWRVVCRRTAGEMLELLNPQVSGAAFRGDDYLDDSWFILLRDKVIVGDSQFDIFLEAVQLIEHPEILHIALALGITPQDLENKPVLQATLRWGEYNETAQVNEQGRATFPPLLWQSIFDERSDAIKSDLQLTIDAIDG